MMKDIRVGSWHQFKDFPLEKWNEEGSLISKDALIKPSVFLCSPVHVSSGSILHAGSKLDKYSYINWDCILFPNVHMGSFCSLARHVQIGLANHPTNWLSTSSFQYNAANFPNDADHAEVVRSKRNLHHPKTIVGSDVWFGANAMVKAGVRIGHGAVIAAGAVVTSNVAPYSIVGGVPAKHIRYRFEKEIVEKLLSLEWWKMSLSQLKSVRFNDIHAAIEDIEKVKATG